MKKLLFAMAMTLFCTCIFAQTATEKEEKENEQQELYMALSDEEKERLESEKLMERSAEEKIIASEEDELALNWDTHPEAAYYEVSVYAVEEAKEEGFRSTSIGEEVLSRRVEENELQLPVKDVIDTKDAFWEG